MITPPLPLVDAKPGDPITSEQWNNVLEAMRRVYEAMNKNLGALAIKVLNQADGKPIRGAIVTVKPTGDRGRPVRTALFAGADLSSYQVSQLLPGAYEVVVEAPGFNTEMREITMPDDGNPLTINVPLVAAQILAPMPSLFGMSLAQALNAVKLADIQVSRIIDSHGREITTGGTIPDDVKAATVLGQVPDPGTPALRLIVAATKKNVGALAVKVLNQADGNPIRGAIVTVKPIESSSRLSFGGTTVAQPPSVDPDRPIRPAVFIGGGENHYQVSQLLPGSYEIVVEAAGFNIETKEITMPDDGNPLTVNVPLVAAEILFPMPSLFGMSLAQALDAVRLKEIQVSRLIDSHGREIATGGTIPDEVKAAMVLGQVPDPGTPIVRLTPIQIHISAKAEFAERIKVPDLRGLTLEEAKAKLESFRLVLGKTETVRQSGPRPGPGLVPSTGGGGVPFVPIDAKD